MVVKKHKKLIFAGILLAFFVLGLLFFFQSGPWLVKKDKLQKADAIVVLMGAMGDRLAAADELYEAGWAPQIVLVNDFVPGKDIPTLHDLDMNSNAQMFAALLVKLGIPDSMITILPGAANSTMDEARIVSAFLDVNPQIQSIILTSSASHTRRASLLFQDALEDENLEVQVITYPSPYSAFNAKLWWRDRNSAKTLVLEYAKLFYFCSYEKYKR